MNVRQILSFFRTPVGRLSIFLLLFFVLVSGGIFRKKTAQKLPEGIQPEGATHATHSRFIREIPPLPKMAGTPQLPPLRKSVELQQKSFLNEEGGELFRSAPLITPPPIEMGIYDASDSEKLSAVSGTPYLPFGRLVRCELLNTVDTSNLLTPIIGLVTHDVWHDGEVVIPAGTEVHGIAGNQPERERVGGGTRWMLVFHDGRELGVSGIALDHAPMAHQESWEISDGSAGLRGSIVQTDRYAEIKAVTAAMLAAAANGFMETKQYMTQYGGVITHKMPGWRSALTSGVERGAQLIAQRLLERGDPIFVRVPAGTTFYLYLTQTLLLQHATVAGSTPIPTISSPNLPDQEFVFPPES